MLTYTAAYRFVDGGVHAEALDFPGAITCGADLDEARRLLAGALVDVAETLLLSGKPLPIPDPQCTDAGADLEEPLHLVLEAGGMAAASSAKAGRIRFGRARAEIAALKPVYKSAVCSCYLSQYPLGSWDHVAGNERSAGLDSRAFAARSVRWVNGIAAIDESRVVSRFPSASTN